jgi:hypothetical protein
VDATAQDAFDELLRAHIWPFLKGRGFKRSKATFHRPVGQNWQVVNFQKSVSSDRDAVRFTVNLAVAIDRLRSGVYDWPEGKRPPQMRCHLRERLGAVMSDRDVWWEVFPRLELDPLAEAIMLALDRYGLPWLDAHASEDAIVALLQDDARIQEELPHHLYWYAELMEKLGNDELRRKADAERKRLEREAELEEEALLRDLGVDPA